MLFPLPLGPICVAHAAVPLRLINREKGKHPYIAYHKSSIMVHGNLVRPEASLWLRTAWRTKAVIWAGATMPVTFFSSCSFSFFFEL